VLDDAVDVVFNDLVNLSRFHQVLDPRQLLCSERALVPEKLLFITATGLVLRSEFINVSFFQSMDAFDRAGEALGEPALNDVPDDACDRLLARGLLIDLPRSALQRQPPDMPLVPMT